MMRSASATRESEVTSAHAPCEPTPGRRGGRQLVTTVQLWSLSPRLSKNPPKSPQWKSRAVLLRTALPICFLPDLFDTSHSLDSTETLLCVPCWRWPQITSWADPSPARALKHHLQLYKRRTLTKHVRRGAKYLVARASAGCSRVRLFNRFQERQGVQVAQPSSQKQTEWKPGKFSVGPWLPPESIIFIALTPFLEDCWIPEVLWSP